MDGCRQLLIDWWPEQQPRPLVLSGHHDGEHAHIRGGVAHPFLVVVAVDRGALGPVLPAPEDAQERDPGAQGAEERNPERRQGEVDEVAQQWAISQAVGRCVTFTCRHG
jgi:hypothetical protein